MSIKVTRLTTLNSYLVSHFQEVRYFHREFLLEFLVKYKQSISKFKSDLIPA